MAGVLQGVTRGAAQRTGCKIHVSSQSLEPGQADQKSAVAYVWRGFCRQDKYSTTSSTAASMVLAVLASDEVAIPSCSTQKGQLPVGDSI